MSIDDPKALRGAFGRFMTGVTVVTTRGEDGTLVGFTANSFTSVSMSPPLLLVCPGAHLSSFRQFSEAGHFAVSVLAEGQEDVAMRFAGSKGDRFAARDWTADVHGSALIDGRAAGFSCKVAQRIPAGDHLVLIGEVTDFDQRDVQGLGWAPGGFFSLARERLANATPEAAVSTRASVILMRDGMIYLEPDGSLPSVDVPAEQGALTALGGALAKRGLATRTGAVFAIYTDDHGDRQVVFRATLDGDPGQLVPLPVDAIETRRFDDAAIGEMLRRYAGEYRNRNFGLYIGDARRGDVFPTESG